MGVDYYAVNKKSKTFYDLGRGGWYSLNDDIEALFDLEYLIHEILHECFCIDDRNWDTEEEKAELVDYVTTRIAPDLFEFVGDAEPSDIAIINDCTDDIYYLRCLGYKCVGTRYYLDKNSDEYKRTMTSNNRHFEPQNAYRYQIDRLSKRQLDTLVFLQDESKY